MGQGEVRKPASHGFLHRGRLLKTRAEYAMKLVSDAQFVKAVLGNDGQHALVRQFRVPGDHRNWRREPIHGQRQGSPGFFGSTSKGGIAPSVKGCVLSYGVDQGGVVISLCHPMELCFPTPLVNLSRCLTVLALLLTGVSMRNMHGPRLCFL